MAKASVNGVDLHYQAMGRGPEVVFVHGLAANLAFWFLGIAPRLAAEYRVIGFDLRGHGRSGMPATGYTTAHMAADLAGLLDQLGLSRIHLVGHSFGGAVALHFALLHPQRVRTLTLADCRIHSLQPFPSSEDGRFWRARRERLRERDVEVKDDTPKVVYTMLEEFGPDGLAPQADGGNGLVAGLGVWNPQSRAAQKWLKLRSTTTLAADVRRVAGLTPSGIRRLQPPALLMFGEESRCLKTCARLRRLLPAARAVLLPGVGHFFPVQVPERFVEELKGFLDPVPPSPAMDAGEAPLIGEAVRPA